MDDLIPIFIVGFVMGMICFIAYVILEVVRSRHRVRATTELQGKLIDRLGAQDIGMFLTSENGGQMLRALADQPAGDVAHVRILRALQSGLVLCALGGGMFLYSNGQTLPADVQDGIRFVATVALSLGVGLLLAAGASYGLSKRMGLLARAEGRSADAV